MAYDKFLIAPLNSGLQTDTRPWLIPDDAFDSLENVYNFRGRIRKRVGSYLLQGSAAIDPSVAQLLSRLRVFIANTNGSGNLSNTAPGAVWQPGQMFSVGPDPITGNYELLTVTTTGAPAAMLATGPSTVHVYNTSNGAFTITGSYANSPVYFYPALPVMGLITYERNALNDFILYAFDTQFAYTYSSGWDRLGTMTWTGDNSQFFWGTSYRGPQSYNAYLFVTNDNPADNIQYYDGTTWNPLVPVINAGGDTVQTALIALPFKDRLVLLNTVETVSAANQSFLQRCRFSQNGDPTNTATGWLQDTPGLGGYIDAPTQEAIVSAEFLRDRLIVFFERSTWELVYIGNQVLPFIWQKINTELGSQSTFSVVPFDKVILTVGNVGIHACNGANVERIDDKIPEEIFNIVSENEGVQRVYGIRDYTVEMVYWTFPSYESDDETSSSIFPDQMLVYNYKTGAWAINDDSITCFGYFQNPFDITWQSTNATWQESEATWNEGTTAAQFNQIIAGNQEGFTFIMDPSTTVNSASLQITNLTISSNVLTFTVYNHNLGEVVNPNINEGDYIYINWVQGITGINGLILPVSSVLNANQFTALIPPPTVISGTYTGGGTLARVSNIDIRTKQYNFYNEVGCNAYVPKVAFYVEATDTGETMVDTYISAADDYSLVTAAANTGTLMGTSVLSTQPYTGVSYEQLQQRFWHVVYLQAEGEVVQMRIYMNQQQMMNSTISFSDFELNAMIIYAMKTYQYF